MAPIFSRKNALFLFLGVFALLFGMAQVASAAECRSYDSSNPAYPNNPNPYWQGAGTITGCTIQYDDPTGGSNLSVCKYRILSNGVQTVPTPPPDPGWTDASGDCSGNSATLSINISIGSGLHCRDNGENKCRVEFKAEDNAGNSATGTVVTLDINYNTAPTTSDIADQTINEDANTGALAFTVGDAETAASSLTLTKDSSNTVLIPTANIVFGGSGANRTVTVSPAENQNGTATITVTVSDGSLTASDTFVLAVTAVNDAPTLDAITDPAAINEDAGSQTVNLSGISAGGGESQALTITATSATTSVIPNPTVTYASPNTTGSLSYTPVFNASGSSVITVTVRDAGLDETAGNADDGIATWTFTVNVTAVNDAPSFTKGANQIVLEDAGAQTVTGWATSISSGPANESGQAVDFIVSNNNNALFSAQPAIAASGTLTYTPTPNANGSATVTVQIHDNGGTANSGVDTSASQTFTITVTAVNDSPIASNGTFTTNEDTAGTGTLVASDVDGNLLTFSIVANGIKGTATITNVSTGVYTYDPNDNQNGTDSFTFKANDGTIDSNTATVSVTITVVNDAPVAADESYSMYEGTTLTRNAAAGVLTNDSDVEGSALTAAVVSIPTNGSLILNSNGSLVYTPIANFNGTDSFTYKANDGAADSNTATVTITVSDGTAPTVDSFKANNKTYPNPPTVNVNGSFLVEWDVSETGGSNLQKVEVWRAWDANGDGVLQFPSEWGDSSPASGTQANPISIKTTNFDSANQDADSLSENPSDGTYWYGLHIVDNAGNCITETGGHCDGVSSDSLDTRTVRGPIKVRMQHNSSPTIQGNVGISPAPPVKAGVALTFSVDWNDSDSGEQVKIHICKDVLSGTSCNAQGSWCASPSFTTNDPATCTYTTLATDGGTKAYNAYVCDDEGACSSSKSGTFLVDTTAPTITIFAITPESPNWANNANPSITVTWNVSDQGGAHLDRVRAYRAVFDNTDPDQDGKRCDDTNKEDCVWFQAGSDAVAPNNSDNWNCSATCNDRVIDSPGSDTWWYGMHVLDKAQNEISEPVPPGPRKALVDTATPTSQIQSPAAGSFQGNNFKVNVADVDTGGSTLNTAECRYSVLTCATGPCNTVLSDASRTCNADTPDINVTTQCNVEGQNSCRVIVKSKDIAGNTNVISEAQNSIRNFSIDLTWPKVDKVSCSSNLSTPCEQVQQGVSTVFRARVSDNIQLANCEFLWRPTSGGSWQNMVAPEFTAIPCQGGHTGDCLETFTSHTFNTAGAYDVRAQCWDSAFHAMPGDFVPVAVETLSVSLIAVPPSGSINTLFDLVATVSGTMTGNINYKFDCGTWELEVNNSSTNPYTAVDLCQYSPPNTYTAKVFVQRGVGTAEDTQSIVVSSNSIPTTTNRLVDAPNSVDYCGVTGYPPVRVRWTFSDADPEDTQGAYQIQVFHGGNTVVDTGKKSGATQSYVFQSTGEQLSWNKTYTWQVRVWDSPNDDVSLFASGPQFTTPKHYYPVPSFTKTPEFPGAQELVQFIDQTGFATGSTGRTWSWDFDSSNGIQADSTQQNPSHTYAQTGAFGVTLQVGDDIGSCSASQSVNVSVPFPEWQEISPF